MLHRILIGFFTWALLIPAYPLDMLIHTGSLKIVQDNDFIAQLMDLTHLDSEISVMSNQSALGERKGSLITIPESLGNFEDGTYFEGLRSIIIFPNAKEYYGFKERFLEYFESKSKFLKPIRSGPYRILKNDSGKSTIQLKNTSFFNGVAQTIIYQKSVLQFRGSPITIFEFDKDYGGDGKSKSYFKQKADLRINLGNSLRFLMDDPNIKAQAKQLESMNFDMFVVGLIEISKFPYGLSETKIPFYSSNIYKNGKRMFSPYKIITVNKKKVALLAITNPMTPEVLERELVKHPHLQNVEVRDPRKEVNLLLEELTKKVDLIVYMTNIPCDNSFLNTQEAYNVPTVFCHGNWSFNPLEKLTATSVTADFGPQPTHRIWGSRVSLNWNKTWSIKTSNTFFGPTKNDGGLDNSSYIKKFMKKEKELLPDYRNIDLNYFIPPEEEFAQYAAHMLREVTNSEIALFKIQVQITQLAGSIPEWTIRSWIARSEAIRTFRITGAVLKVILANIKNANSVKVSGVDAEGKVNHSLIQEEATYTVSASNQVLGMAFMPTNLVTENRFIWVDDKLKDSEDGDIIYLADAIIKEIKNQRKQFEDQDKNIYYETLKTQFKGPYSDEKGLWTVNLKELSLSYSKVKNTQGDEFQQVRNDNVNSLDQQRIAFSGDLLLNYSKKNFVNEWRVKGRLAEEQIEVPPLTVINEAEDDLVFSVELGFAPWSPSNWLSFLGRVGPFANLAYDTEFRKNGTIPRQKLLDSIAGIKAREGSWLNGLFAGVLLQSDRSVKPNDEEWGFTGGFEIAYPFFNNQWVLSYNSSIKHFFPRKTDTVDDLEWEWSNDIELKASLGNNFQLGPFYKTFYYSSKVFDKNGLHQLFGVELSMNQLWKIGHSGWWD